MTESSSLPTNPQSGLQFERDEDFASLYANHVWYEMSTWDLRLLFGQLDQGKGPNVVTQHTAITLSWQQVKIMSYFLQVNLAMYEAQNGRIQIPASVLPPKFPSESPGLEDDTVTRATAEKARGAYERIFES